MEKKEDYQLDLTLIQQIEDAVQGPLLSLETEATANLHEVLQEAWRKAFPMYKEEDLKDSFERFFKYALTASFDNSLVPLQYNQLMLLVYQVVTSIQNNKPLLTLPKIPPPPPPSRHKVTISIKL
jgi:hypothetical protein